MFSEEVTTYQQATSIREQTYFDDFLIYGEMQAIRGIPNFSDHYEPGVDYGGQPLFDGV